MFFPYRAESLRPALIMIVVVLVAALLAPDANLRILILVLLSGPLVWSALQLLRRGRGVRVGGDTLELQSGILRRSSTIPIERIQAYLLDSGDRLALAYFKPRTSEPGEDVRPPRLKMFVSAALDDPNGLAAALPLANGLTPGQLNSLLIWRRIRRLILFLLALFIGAPTLIVIALRALIAIFGLFRGR